MTTLESSSNPRRKTNSGIWLPYTITGLHDEAPTPTDVTDQPENPGPPAEVQPDRQPAPPPRSAVPQRSGWAKLGDWLWEHLSGNSGGTARVNLSAVLVPGMFAIATALAAFLLSFQMILPVVTAAGWTPPVSYLGPVVIDVAAVASAFMGVLSDHATFKRTGHALLLMSTAASIVLNLAGHQVKQQQTGPQASHVPGGWSWAVELFSVMVPTLLALMIHVTGTALSIYLAQQACDRAQNERQAARSKQRPTTSVTSAVPQPARPRTTTSRQKTNAATAIQVGVEEQAITPAALRDALKRRGLNPGSDSSRRTNWCPEIRKRLVKVS